MGRPGDEAKLGFHADSGRWGGPARLKSHLQKTPNRGITLAPETLRDAHDIRMEVAEAFLILFHGKQIQELERQFPGSRGIT